MKIDIAKQTEKIITVLNHLCRRQLYTWITFNGNLQYKFRYLEVTKGLINFAVQFYIYIISVQSRIDKEGVIFDPLFTDLGVIW